jgi:putative transposase
MAKEIAFSITPGSEVCYMGEMHTVKRVIDLSSVLLEKKANNSMLKADIKNLAPPSLLNLNEDTKTHNDPVHYSETEWETALKRYGIIKPILENRLSTTEIVEISNSEKVHLSTLYRWIEKYNRTEQISSLVPDKRDGGKGKSRLTEEIDLIINTAIEDIYLTKQRKSAQKVYQEVCTKCKNAGLLAPAQATIRRRIKSISEEYKTKLRFSSKLANEMYSPNIGKYNQANYPYSIIQIDHTKLDIIVVDEVYRRPIDRPWITLAIDVFSRMVAGFYVSFDPPGALGTGMCVSNAILPKEMLLSKYNIEAEWPCWGIMKTIHVDNAKEFRGNMLKRAAEEYKINLEWRPVKTPHWGGHIERLLGTLLKEIHTLPGTTFSNIKQKGSYNSAAKASLTLKELEEWLITYITQVYHNKFHSGIGMSPIAKYNEGIFGSDKQIGKGLPLRIFNERKVRLDFMPYVERSIQDYGVQIDHIHYYDDKLRPYINSIESTGNSIAKQRRKFIFKRDPRDISVIFFYDPELKQYFEIPYRNTSHPPITIWEYREVERWLISQGKNTIDEEAIFEGYERMKIIENEAVVKTRVKRRVKNNTKRGHSMIKSLRAEFSTIETTKLQPNIEIENNKNIKPFEDIDI